MTSVRYLTFSDLTVAAFETYAKTLFQRHVGDTERQRNAAYLQQVLASDDAASKVELRTVADKRRLSIKQRAKLDEVLVDHAFDFSQAPSLFTEVAKSDAEILALLTQDNVTVYLRDRTLTGNIRITGDNVRLIGLGATGSATADTLATNVTFNTDRIEIGGNNIVIEGIHFNCSGEYAVTFVSTKGVGLELRDCKVQSTHSTYADARFYFGDGAGGGDVAIENCLVSDFGSWMLGDATTASAFGTTVRLASFKIDGTKFANCAGCFAVRGPPTGQPNGPVSFTNNVVAFGAGGVHAAFWDCFEASEGITQVICTGNKVTGMVKSGHRGFFQCWSKNPVPWSVTFEKNEIANFQAAIHIACNATFYAPNTHASYYKIASEAGKITNTDHSASFVYPYIDATKTYAPENIAAEAQEPAVSFADGLTVFAHA